MKKIYQLYLRILKLLWAEVADPQSQAQEAPKAAPIAEESDKEKNFRRMRLAMEEQQRQIQELQRTLSQAKQAEAPQEEAEQDPLAGVADDDLVSVKQVRSYAERVAKDAVRQVLKEQKGATIEERFRERNPDYDKIVTKENLDELFEEMPELKPTLQRMYAMALKGEDVDPVALSYKLIKRFKGEQDMGKAEKASAQLTKNAQKPLSSNAIKSSALNEAHKFGQTMSKEDKARIFAETVAAAKQRN